MDVWRIGKGVLLREPENDSGSPFTLSEKLETLSRVASSVAISMPFCGLKIGRRIKTVQNLVRQTAHLLSADGPNERFMMRLRKTPALDP